MRTTGGCVRHWSFALAASFLAAWNAPAADWWLEGGPSFRVGMSYKVSGSSYAQNLGRHAAPGPLAIPASIGPANAYADREYDNGYVRLDSGTLNPEAVGGPGNTWNWAYDNAAQYNAQAGMLSFFKQGSPGYTTLLDQPASGRGDGLGCGLQLMAGLPIHKSGRWRVDLGFGFQGLWGSEFRMNTGTYQERISRYDVTDRYGVAETVHPEYGFAPPRTVTGGYAGTYDGPAGGASSWIGGFPTITNVPSVRDANRVDLSTAGNAIQIRVAADYYEVFLGPRVRYAMTEELSFHFMPKIGLSCADVRATRSEAFIMNPAGGGSATLETWNDRARLGVARFTAGITAGLDVDLGKGYYAGVYGGYQWVAGDIRFALGPNTISINGSGYVAGLFLGKNF